LAKVNKKCP